MRYGMFSAALLGATALAAGTACAQSVDRRTFASPPPIYKPAITLTEGSGNPLPTLEEGAEHVVSALGGGGVMISPDGDPSRRKSGDPASMAKLRVGLLDKYAEGATPWLPRALPGEAMFGSYLADGGKGPKRPSLGYLTPEWFAQTRKALDVVAKAKGFAVYYDETGFPSGNADYTIPANYHRKLLRRNETTVSARQPFVLDWRDGQAPVSVVAWNPSTGERVDLLAQAKDKRIAWTGALGHWRVQSFYVDTAAAGGFAPEYYGSADYLDPEATSWFIAHAYDPVFDGLRRYFGPVIKYAFFDDVGFFPDERTWNPAVAARFEKLTGKPAALYYPALWEDIGPDTAAARVGFFKARAEIIGETFPKMIADWSQAHGIRATGHSPGNYDLQPTDMYGDPFKFYAHTDVPTADVLWGYGFARNGFKLISSVSAARDLPETAAEAFSVDNDAIGYKRLIELYVRGFNLFVLGGRNPSKPLGTPQQLTDWAGRSSYLLRGGRHVADVAVVFPIESLQAFYAFDAPGHSPEMPHGTYAYRDADYQAVGEMLLSGLHRDFTFVHPDALGSDKLQVAGNTLVMQNRVNREQYRVLVLPGGDVISVSALRKIRQFWEAGGAVVATSLLPTRSAEFGQDAEVRAIVSAMFGANGMSDAADPAIHTSSGGGRALFLRQPSEAALGRAFDRLGIPADVSLAGPVPTAGGGVVGYTHRVRDGRHIYYFGNSSDAAVDATVTLRGHLSRPQLWNPHDGKVMAIRDVRYRKGPHGEVTEFRLKIAPVSAMAVVGKGG